LVAREGEGASGAWPRDEAPPAGIGCSVTSDAAPRTPDDRGLEEAIVELLRSRAPGKTICPSEVARALAPEDWRTWMEPVRAAARRLVARGAIEITQRGRVVRGPTRGPIRLRLSPRP
jgi:hypothetical protein